MVACSGAFNCMCSACWRARGERIVPGCLCIVLTHENWITSPLTYGNSTDHVDWVPMPADEVMVVTKFVYVYSARYAQVLCPDGKLRVTWPDWLMNVT